MLQRNRHLNKWPWYYASAVTPSLASVHSLSLLVTISFSSTISMLNNNISADFRYHFSYTLYLLPLTTFTLNLYYTHAHFFIPFTNYDDIYFIPILYYTHTSSFMSTTYDDIYFLPILYHYTHTFDDVTLDSLPYFYSLAILLTFWRHYHIMLRLTSSFMYTLVTTIFSTIFSYFLYTFTYFCHFFFT